MARRLVLCALRTARRNWLVVRSLVAVCAAGPGWAGEAERTVVPPPRLIVIRLSADAFAPLAGTVIDRQTQVDEVILGTRVVGLAQTHGQPAVHLVEDPQIAGFQMVLTGTTHSRTVGKNGPVTIYSRSQTTFRATKRVVFAPGVGFQAEPARVEADTRTATDDIQTRRQGPIGRLILRQAWSRIGESREEATRIARERTARRIAELFDQHLDDQLAQLNEALTWRNGLSVARDRGLEPAFACSTTKNHMQIIATSGGAEISSPELPQLDQTTPVQVWVHESIIGRTWMPAVKCLARSGFSAKNVLDWSQELMPAEIHADLSRRKELERLQIGMETCQDWIVVQFGEPTRIATTAAAGF
jgi:hypothetical protein